MTNMLCELDNVGAQCDPCHYPVGFLLKFHSHLTDEERSEVRDSSSLSLLQPQFLDCRCCARSIVPEETRAAEPENIFVPSPCCVLGIR